MALFGTDGVRGVAGVDLTAELAHDLAVAAAEVLTESGEFAGHRPVAIVGEDSRESGSYLVAAICKGLNESGVDVRKVGVLPTPAVSYLITELKADLGVMVSASHNPARDNGIKFFSRNGRKLDDALEVKIEELLGKPWQRPAGMNAGQTIDDGDAREKYISYLLSTIETRFDGLKIVVDCANGAASFVAPEVLRRAGAEVVAISASPNGLNINENCGSTHLENVIAKVKSEKADLGIAHDGDADRVLAIDHEGNLIDGDYILGILAEHTELPTKSVVGTVMTNLGLIRALENRGIGFVATPVGDRYVLERMLAEGHMLGGEQSGHIIMRKYANTGDGLLTALHLISHIAQSKKTLKDLASFMSRYPQVLINVPGVSKEKLAHNQAIKGAVSRIESTLGARGRVLLRASGTEPLIRVMIEAEVANDAQQFAESLAALVKSELAL
ncbi:MAG: phosphoglucosamine mutase [Actinobacteria bacterium]|jgi:phosphoglucosamine mutase|nr:phosphoglucosamine mutase [Actinomycetota bacterium]NCU89548.1 phosphoglucosamine mutase [Actinomycetota bacterium]NDE54591.1 phosphoglucosamine mutase [Actinomycetota bacterium]